MWRIPLLFLLLAGCIRDQVLVTRDAWTGHQTITVQEREIYRDDDAILVARPTIIVKDGQTGYAVLTNLRRRDANGPRIERVTSLGHDMVYVRHDRLRTHCIDGCQAAEVGAVHLSEATFRAAARSGLPLRVWGLRGRAEGIVPAEAFVRVLAQLRQTP
ncbi:hypothetical protein AB3Y40_05545 [Yoonia sp. R2331]|uniref:hypothetical protein n=1 Tax=Yoonia sp. R2331 TaxID=3237238 RepID=UPI0034E56660